MQKEVEVVLVNYNGGLHICNCINSLLTQTYNNLDILFWGNYSENTFTEIAKKVYPQVYLVKGQYSNRFANVPVYTVSYDEKSGIQALNTIAEDRTSVPGSDKIRLILDNYSSHMSQETQEYLNTIPGRFEFVFAPAHGSWLYMVEGFF